ncbi:RNA-directed DNA polymerase from mobile element jockey [Octopus vulgaris]|uniref:RNA-directed DNA polymerase from mobile element jockey n=1 Tax=Octopus vulgaris TaxID=6645 RepID=A0AA36F619_OCTVU|nr:RNA-directed DNA polymerase from mobile element jockey [Octopus vulgaris]
MFLLCINDLPDFLDGRVLLFVDDVKLVSPRNQYDILQLSLNRAWNWAKEWNLNLNASKCSHLPIDSPPNSPLTIGHKHQHLKMVTEEKDLSLIIDTTFKLPQQGIEAANKARRNIFLIHRSFGNFSMDVFWPVYITLVRPILEYYIQTSNPYLQKDIHHLERVQHLATRMGAGLSNLAQEEHLRRLALPSLKRRRMQGDLIQFSTSSTECKPTICGDFHPCVR